MKIGNRDFEIGRRTYIIGILNITPDSFSDGGAYTRIDAALLQAEKMAAGGADIIEIGGESTRPGSAPVTAEEELSRILPVIRRVKERLDIPVSVDTMKSATAEKALDAGADMINDVGCLRADPALASTCARHNVPLCIMHSRERMEDTRYDSLLKDIKTELTAGVQIALREGLSETSVIIDPGIGFSKTAEQSLHVMKNLDYFCRLGYPLMLGTSRKRFIGSALSGLPASDRLEGTLATTVIGIMKGCDFIRVHDVPENKRAAVMTDAVIRR